MVSIFRTPYDASVRLSRFWYHVVVIVAVIGVVGIVVVIGFVDAGWQNQGYACYIVTRTYTEKVGLIDWRIGKRGEKGRKRNRKKQKKKKKERKK